MFASSISIPTVLDIIPHCKFSCGEIRMAWRFSENLNKQCFTTNFLLNVSRLVVIEQCVAVGPMAGSLVTVWSRG